MDILEKKTARFMVVGDITTTVNKGRQAGRQAGPMSGLLFLWMSMGLIKEVTARWFEGLARPV